MRYAIMIVGTCLGLLAVGGVLGAQTKDKDADKEKQSELTEINGKKLAEWIADIKHSDPAMRENAIRTVPAFGRAARKAVKALINELRDQDPSLRVNAAISLGLIGMDEADRTEGVRALIRVLSTDTQINVKYQAALTLGKLGADAKAATPLLRTVLLDPYYGSWELRQAAALALAGTGWELKESETKNPKDSYWVCDPKAVGALVTAAQKDSSSKVRMQALTSLIYLGMPNDRSVLDNEKTGLLAILRDKHQDPVIGIWARVALMRVDKLSDTYLKDIGEKLKHPELAVRTNAAQALAAIGPSASSRVTDLLAALHDKYPLVTVAAINALVQIGDDSPPVMTALDKLADGTKDEGLKQYTKNASEQLKVRANEVRQANLNAPKGPELKATDPKDPPKKKVP
jgi:HEAT repeat protein